MLTYWRHFPQAKESYNRALQIIDRKLENDSNNQTLQIARQNVVKLRTNLERFNPVEPTRLPS